MGSRKGTVVEACTTGPEAVSRVVCWISSWAGTARDGARRKSEEMMEYFFLRKALRGLQFSRNSFW